MKFTKIFYGNQYVTKFKCGEKKMSFIQKMGFYIKRYILLSAKFCVIAWIVTGGIAYTQKYHPRVVYADKEIVMEVKGKAPVMERIARCESGGNHIEKATGQVVMRSNTNKSVDVGKYQINSVWFKKAAELGLDITKEEDNERMAYYIYESMGTEPWYASKTCWSK